MPQPKITEPEKLSKSLTEWFARFGRDLPWRRTHDPYAIMVSEFMLQQTQVATVIPYFERWLVRFPDFATLAAASEPEVLAAWQGLGYYARARNLHRAAKEVVARHGGVLPDDPTAIAALPGVGRYTAGAIASFAFDRPIAAVDANIARVLARIIDLQEAVDSTSGAAKIWAAAETLLPQGETGGRLHTSALMELGALVCLPRQPQCLLCPVCGACAAKKPELLPIKKPKKKTVALTEECEWHVSADHKILLEQQTGTRWRGMWKLPRASAEVSGEPLLEFDYPFTHHRVTLRVFGVPEARVKEAATDHRWVPVAELDRVAIAAPHKRAIRQLLERR